MSTNQIIPLMGEMAILVKVVETGSFSETARQLGTTPSAISRAVARLENALGTRLLQRTTRKLRLSESGQEVYLRCVDLVSAAQAVMAASGQINPEPQGRVRISVPKAVGRFVIHPHIPDFLAKYPKIDIELQLKDNYVDLIDDQVDLAIRITDRPSPGLMGRRLLKIDHILCATKEYLAAHGIPSHPNDLKNHNCIFLGEEPSDSHWKFLQDNKKITVNISGRYAVNHTGARLDAVLHHLGIGSLPSFTARHALQQGQIVHVLSDWTFTTNYCGDAWVLYPPTKHLQPNLSAFITFMAERLSQTPKLGNPLEDNQIPTPTQPYELPEIAK